MTQSRLLCFLAMASLWIAGCTRDPARSALPSGVAPTKVEVEKPKRQTIRRVEEAIGRLEAAEVVPIQAKVSGYIKPLSLDIGTRVKKGQVLAEISAPEIEADLNEKRSGVGQAQGRLVQARAGVSLAQASEASTAAKVTEARASLRRAEADAARWRSEFARTKQLADERAVTQSLLDESRSKLESAEAALDADRAKVVASEASLAEAKAAVEKARADVVAAEAGVDLAKAEMNHAQVMVNYTTIIAPFDGVITLRNADSGHLAAAGTQGEPLFVLARTNILTAALILPERTALAVADQAVVEIRLPALKDRVIKANVSRRSHVIDPSTGTSRIEVDLPNSDQSLQPGLYLQAAIVLEEHPDVLTIPFTAVIRSAGQFSVACIEGGKVTRQAIEIGIEDGLRTEVKGGLSGNENIVKENGGALAAGQSVEIAEAAKPAK